MPQKGVSMSTSQETVTDGFLAAAVELGRQACQGGDPNPLFFATAEVVKSLLRVEFCSIWELLADDCLLLVSDDSSHDGFVDRVSKPLTDSPIGRVILSREPVIVTDL